MGFSSSFRLNRTTPSRTLAPPGSPRRPLQDASRTTRIGESRREIGVIFSNSGYRRRSSIPAAPVSLASIPHIYTILETSLTTCTPSLNSPIPIYRTKLSL
ncbi:Os06g0333600 [Oryza sativa Japonica Group]|uniref:Os06g0333600 protein n=1 Tax=Oryza sativa subsp. japonica TaxID=39947 RepID=A0A0P0WWG9_ORYSJ|nr:Os06g0333600 [Oryza sativa Japonica Group]